MSCIKKNDCHKWIIHFTRHWNEWRLTTLPKSDNGSQFVRIRGQRTKKSWGFIWLLTRNFLAYFFSSLGPHISKKKYETSEFFHMKLKLIHYYVFAAAFVVCLFYSLDQFVLDDLVNSPFGFMFKLTCSCRRKETEEQFDK